MKMAAAFWERSCAYVHSKRGRVKREIYWEGRRKKRREKSKPIQGQEGKTTTKASTYPKTRNTCALLFWIVVLFFFLLSIIKDTKKTRVTEAFAARFLPSLPLFLLSSISSVAASQPKYRRAPPLISTLARARPDNHPQHLDEGLHGAPVVIDLDIQELCWLVLALCEMSNTCFAFIWKSYAWLLPSLSLSPPPSPLNHPCIYAHICFCRLAPPGPGWWSTTGTEEQGVVSVCV